MASQNLCYAHDVLHFMEIMSSLVSFKFFERREYIVITLSVQQYIYIYEMLHNCCLNPEYMCMREDNTGPNKYQVRKFMGDNSREIIQCAHSSSFFTDY